MTRVKGATHAIKRRRNLLQKTKGYRFNARSKERAAKDAWIHAMQHAFRHRKDKKRDFRAMWNIHITAGLKSAEDTRSYSVFMHALKKKGIGVNRKMLAHLAEFHADSFKRITEYAK